MLVQMVLVEIVGLPEDLFYQWDANTAPTSASSLRQFSQKDPIKSPRSTRMRIGGPVERV